MNGPDSSCATKRLRWLVLLTAATAVGTTTRAEAQFGPDYSGGSYFYQQRQRTIHRQKPHKHVAARKEAPHKDTGPKPQGPLVIAISIDRQKLTIYDSNGVFAESPVSTGMRGHSTPMGVFSIIEKQRFHRSNIYSGAPMPYMQRITWSGVAMHAGVLPGYPASHGCIRMPAAFAVKMYHWTKLGARVIVTPGEMTPSSFSHPLLASTKLPPQPSPKPDNSAAEVKSVNAEPAIDLKSTIGDVAVHDATTGGPQAHDEVATPADKATPEDKGVNAKPAVELKSTIGGATVHDTTTAGPQTHDGTAATADKATPTYVERINIKGNTRTRDNLIRREFDFSEGDAYDRTLVNRAERRLKNLDYFKSVKITTEPGSSSDRVVLTVDLEERTGTFTMDGPQSADDSAPAKLSSNATSPDQNKAENAGNAKPVESATAPASTGTKPVEATKGSTEGSKEKPDATMLATSNTAPAAAPDAKKDQLRLGEPAPTTKPEAPKRAGQIAVFISRKDAKIYVRQNFAPLFEAPVTVTPSDRPLGTHVFTAETDEKDANALRWSVVSLPASRSAERGDEGRTSRHRRRATAVIQVAEKPTIMPDSPSEALDRITIPEDVVSRINGLLTTGASIVISDQGINQGETGEGTDFIVRWR